MPRPKKTSKTSDPSPRDSTMSKLPSTLRPTALSPYDYSPTLEMQCLAEEVSSSTEIPSKGRGKRRRAASSSPDSPEK